MRGPNWDQSPGVMSNNSTGDSAIVLTLLRTPKLSADYHGPEV